MKTNQGKTNKTQINYVTTNKVSTFGEDKVAFFASWNQGLEINETYTEVLNERVEAISTLYKWVSNLSDSDLAQVAKMLLKESK